MPAVLCSSCGRSIDLPEGFSRAKIRCPGCGYYADVPVAQRGAADTPAQSEPPAPTRLPTAKPAARAVDPGPTPFQDQPSSDGYNPLGEEGYGFSEPVPPRPKAVAKPTRVRPARDPKDPRPNFEPDEPAGAPLLKGTQDEDDDQPYAVPGTGLQKCRHCRCDLPLNAEFCVHCGRDIRSGEKVKKVYQPIYREWHESYPLATRLQALAGLQVINFAVAVLAFVAQDLSFRDYGGIFTNMVFTLIQLAIQAFLIGTYDTIQINRNAKGQTTITRIRRIAFLPLPAEKVDWKKSTMVGCMGTHDPGIFTWLICAYLFMLACLPGILFYWFVIRPERFTVNLANEYGSTDEVLFRTKNREFGVSIAELISECTKLTLRRVL